MKNFIKNKTIKVCMLIYLSWLGVSIVYLCFILNKVLKNLSQACMNM